MNYTKNDIVNKIEILIKKGTKRFIIYPFGRRGKEVKSILNIFFNIKEYMIIDSKLCESFDSIYGLKDIDYCDWSETIILFSCDNLNIYQELLDKLLSVVPRQYVEDIFCEQIQQKMKNKLENTKLTEKIASSSLITNKMCYTLPETKSIFFLPYIYTDFIQKSIFLTDEYYENLTLKRVFEFQDGVIRSKIEAGGGVVDIGSNIGNHVIYYAEEIGAKEIHAFEPVKGTFDILRINIELNSLEEYVTLYQMGLSDERSLGEIKHYDYTNIGGTQIRKGNGDIHLDTLDSFEFNNIALIKIDVETMEMAVLRGGINTIQRNRPYMLIEIFPENYTDVESFLHEYGYNCISLDADDNYLFYPC